MIDATAPTVAIGTKVEAETSGFSDTSTHWELFLNTASAVHLPVTKLSRKPARRAPARANMCAAQVSLRGGCSAPW